MLDDKLHYTRDVDVYRCVTLWAASDKSRGPKSLVLVLSEQFLTTFHISWFGRAYLYNLFALQVTLLSLSLWIITRTEKVVKQVCGY